MNAWTEQKNGPISAGQINLQCSLQLFCTARSWGRAKKGEKKRGRATRRERESATPTRFAWHALMCPRVNSISLICSTLNPLAGCQNSTEWKSKGAAARVGKGKPESGKREWATRARNANIEMCSSGSWPLWFLVWIEKTCPTCFCANCLWRQIEQIRWKTSTTNAEIAN